MVKAQCRDAQVETWLQLGPSWGRVCWGAPCRGNSHLLWGSGEEEGIRCSQPKGPSSQAPRMGDQPGKQGAPVCLAPYLCKRASGWMAQGMGQEPLSGLPRGAGAGPVWSAPPQAKKAPELLTFTQGHSGGPSMSVPLSCPDFPFPFECMCA